MNADQRYLYIRDLNAQTVCALAATASEMQTPALRDFIHDHLAFSADIRATIPPTGITSYAIEFHFPFYVLERSSDPRMDHRGLRQIDDISFLPRPFKDGPNPAGSDYLYESQISCCVTGYDDFIWNAYMLVDLYHEDPEKIPNMENLKNYEGFCAGADVPEDPLTADGTPLENMRQNPRGYFLKTLLSRAREVRERWTILVMKIKSYVNSCIKEPGVRDILAATRSNGVDNADTSQDQHKVESSAKRDDRKRLERDRERRRQLTSWASQTTLLLRKLIECLDSNIDAWRTFSSGGINYFYQPYAPWNVGEPERKSLLAIAHVFKDLLTLRDRLCSLKGLCEDIIPGSVSPPSSRPVGYVILSRC
ncbi:hypothetical protein HD806DRAFT_521185 [Xylariaceae sp. AK1471]|nr:hypothetical protein HD806DRAFT_521185 [Xylariaceae sp. AK1471]